jgi:transcriptional regulator NrdR family protein
MKCRLSNCDGKTRVVETDDQGYRIRRRRECRECSHRFSTMEWAAERRQRMGYRYGGCVWRRKGSR